MEVRLKGISVVDGSTVEMIVNKSDTQSGSEILSSLHRYTYSSVHNAPPMTSQIRTDTDVVNEITKIWIHRLDFENVDLKFFFIQLKAGMKLYLQDMNNSDARAIYILLGDAIDDGDYITFNVECDSTSNTPLEGTGILIAVFT